MGTRSRTLLIGSLTGLLFLVAVTGAAAFFTIKRIEATEAALRKQSLVRVQTLEQLRDAIYLSSALARDLFDDPTARDRLIQLKATTDRDAPIGELRAEVTAYWKVLDLMSDMAARPHAPGVETYFRHQLTQRRDAMLNIANKVAHTVDLERTTRESEIASMYQRFRQLLLGEILLIILIGAVLAITTIRLLSKLERDARRLSLRLVNAQEEERRSIARELHDEVGQSLTALRLDVAPLKPAADAVERLIEEVRRIALSLRPSMLNDLGLVPALEWQAREIASRSGLHVHVHADESASEVPETHRTCIYRVAQEALQNCVRHSGAGRIEVGLSKRQGSVSLQVEDNGKGFSPARTAGLGLLGMKERVTQLNGRLRITSEPGKGTCIIADLPL